MYVESVPNRNSRPAVLLRESWREDGRVRKRTIANLSDWPDEMVQALKLLLKGTRLVPEEQALEIQRAWPHGHVAAVLGTLRKIGLEKKLHPRKSRQRDLVTAMVVARIIDPGSKLATALAFDDTSSLGHVLDLGTVNVDELYGAMDWLLERQPKIEASLAKQHLQDRDFVLYDLTSTYLEGRCCPLASIGYSRDGKKNRLQIVFGLLTDTEGRPIAVEVFSGNTADPSTVASRVELLTDRFSLRDIVVVGDRGMITSARIREDLKPNGLGWITSLRAPAIRKLADQGALQLSLFDQQDLAEIEAPEDYPGERLIVCRNPLLAEQRARKRQALLAATEVELGKILKANQREKKPLRDDGKIGVRVGKVLNRFKMAKHFEIHIEAGSFSFERKISAIKHEASFDGLYVIRTNVSHERLDAQDTVRTYKSLSRVERAFRCLKTSDLEVRPIYHRLESRVRAHIFLCTLAYYVEWHLRRELAPLLFQDQHPEEGEARRESVVAPAQRSESADLKASTKRTDDGQPARAFRDLLATLATLTLNQVSTAADPSRTFLACSRPTPCQQAAFDLLHLSPNM